MPDAVSGPGPAAARSRRVLVTGGAGFIGHHLVRHLSDRGRDVVAVDDLRVEPLVPPPDGLWRTSVGSIELAGLRDVDVVVHLASHKSVPESVRRPLAYMDNIMETERLLRRCADAGVRRVLVASSCEVYGIAPTVPTHESAPLAPRSPYACSKAAMEMLCRMYQAAELATGVTVVRLFNVYGPGERPDALVPRLCMEALTTGSMPVEGSGEQRRDLSYVDDVVGHLAGLTEAPSLPPAVNLGSGTSQSVLDVVRAVSELRPGVSTRPSPGRSNEIDEFRADTSVLTAVLGPVRPTSFRAGIRRTFDWWADRVGGTAAAAPAVGRAGSGC